MDRWKSRGGKSQRRERQKKDDQKSERVRGEKDQRARKGRKVAKHCVFHCFVAPEGRKVGSLKRRVWSHLVGGAVKNCTLLWREAHFEV